MKYFISYMDACEMKIEEYDSRRSMITRVQYLKGNGFEMLCIWTEAQSLRKWALYSGKLQDGTEVLSLMQPNGHVLCEYTEGTDKTWHVYFHGLPKKEFTSKEAAIRNAEGCAGHPLTIQSVREMSF